jgi:glycine C-acetyltransferase
VSAGPTDFLKQELDELKSSGGYRPLFELQSAQQPLSIIRGRLVVNLSSNNYLGLATHPRMIRAAHEAIDRFGVGTAAVRIIIGTMTIHEQLERRLAEFKGTPAALTFQSGFATNVALCQSLMSDERDLLISDEFNHASIVDGARLAKASRQVYRHADVGHLDEILTEHGRGRRRILIVTDGVFSVDGDIAPLPQIMEVAERFGAMVMVDDAHATGVLGKNGAGTPSHFGLSDRVPIQIGTLSKAVAAVGGYVAGSEALRDFLIHRARPFMFSSSHPPSVAATCLEAINIMCEEPQLHRRLWENARYFKSALGELGFDTGRSETPITPVMVRDTAKTTRFSDRLFEEGVFVQGIGFPIVARGQERLRTIVTAAHTRESLDQALAAFKKVGRELGVIR